MKAFHIINEGGTVYDRRPHSSQAGTLYNPSTAFLPHEESQFLNAFLPCDYGEMTASGNGEEQLKSVTQWMEKFTRFGLRYRDKNWRVIYGDWPTSHGNATLAPAESGIKSFAQIGLRTFGKTLADMRKVAKRIKRIKARHEWSVIGRILDASGEITTVCLGDGYEFRHRHVDLDSLDPVQQRMADGMLLVNTDLLTRCGVVQAKEGWGAKGTAVDPLGLTKGFMHAKDDLEYGIVTYGVKPEVTFDRFFFGSLGELKAGDAYSDLQAVLNFDHWESRLLPAEAVYFFETVQNAAQDEHRLRQVFLTYLRMDDQSNDRETWTLIKALESGVSILINPGLFRRVYNHLMTRVLNCEKGRVPLDRVSARADLMPELGCFDENGDIHLERSRIRAGTVVAMDLPRGELVLYRQPSGHALEHTKAINDPDRAFNKYRGRNRIMMGPASITDQLAPMNGADLDDSVMAVFAPHWVERMKRLAYPVSDKVEAQSQLQPDEMVANRYIQRVSKSNEQYTVDHFLFAISEARKFALTIGPIVNAIMLDTSLSGQHKESMLQDLAEKIVAEPDPDRKVFLYEAAVWLNDREDYQLRDVASNLEAVIDYINMGKGDAVALSATIQKIPEVMRETKVFPVLWTLGGFRDEGRIPKARRDSRDYAVAKTQLCRNLAFLAEERDRLQEAFKEMEWRMVTPISPVLDELFPSYPDLKQEARDLRTWWREEWQRSGDASADSDRSATYKRLVDGEFDGQGKLVEEGIRQRFCSLSPEIQMHLAVEIARQTYRDRHMEALKDANGKRRQYPDGLLWTNPIGNAYIAAMKEAGLTGEYATVEMDSRSRRLVTQNSHIAVRVSGGNVYRKSDGFFIGFASDLRPSRLTENPCWSQACWKSPNRIYPSPGMLRQWTPAMSWRWPWLSKQT